MTRSANGYDYCGKKTRTGSLTRWKRLQGTQAEGDTGIGSFGDEKERRGEVEILRQQGVERSERLVYSDVARTEVDDAENRFTVGDGERSEVAVMGEDDWAFGKSAAQQDNIGSSMQAAFPNVKHIAAFAA